MKKELLKDDKLRIYICSDLEKLNESFCGNYTFDGIISKYFPKSSFNSSKPFKVKQTWDFKKDEHINESLKSTKNDYIIGLGSTESSFVRLTSSVSINSYKHADYPGMLVLNEYFCQTEVLI